MEFHEIDKQPYADASFSAGLVYSHPVDTIYLKMERTGEKELLILLRDDEATRIAALLANAVWSLLLLKMAVEAHREGDDKIPDREGDA